VFDLGLARMRVPVRRAREFMERTKAEADLMRRAVVVDVVDMVGDVRWGEGVLFWGSFLGMFGLCWNGLIVCL
jgi:hypothetical protein